MFIWGIITALGSKKVVWEKGRTCYKLIVFLKLEICVQNSSKSCRQGTLVSIWYSDSSFCQIGLHFWYIWLHMFFVSWDWVNQCKEVIGTDLNFFFTLTDCFLQPQLGRLRSNMKLIRTHPACNTPQGLNQTTVYRYQREKTIHFWGSQNSRSQIVFSLIFFILK